MVLPSFKSIFIIADALILFSLEFACDYPGTNKMVLNIMMSIAEYEAQRISENTKAALKVAKANGKKLGNPDNLTEESRIKSISVRCSKANSNENNIRAIAMLKPCSILGSARAAQSVAHCRKDGRSTLRGRKQMARE